MKLLDPETFVDQPYVAGLNQGAHIVVGAALVCAITLLLSIGYAIALAMFLAFSLELWQYLKRGAQYWDFLLDFAFWSIGIVFWGCAIKAGSVLSYTIFFPFWLTLIMGAVMAVFSLLKPPSKEL